MGKCIIICFCFIHLRVHSAFACFSTSNQKRFECSENEKWVPNMAQLPNGTKEHACEIMMLMDSDLSPQELCQRMRDFYSTISELDRQLLHIVWWSEIDCKNINRTAIDPFYPFLDSEAK